MGKQFLFIPSLVNYNKYILTGITAMYFFNL